jgi:hypothetical protein
MDEEEEILDEEELPEEGGEFGVEDDEKFF